MVVRQIKSQMIDHKTDIYGSVGTGSADDITMLIKMRSSIQIIERPITVEIPSTMVYWNRWRHHDSSDEQ